MIGIFGVWLQLRLLIILKEGFSLFQIFWQHKYFLTLNKFIYFKLQGLPLAAPLLLQIHGRTIKSL